MNTTQVLPAGSSGVASRGPAAGAYKFDISRGERIGRVSSEWFSRLDDERYLSLSILYEAIRTRAERAGGDQDPSACVLKSRPQSADEIPWH